MTPAPRKTFTSAAGQEPVAFEIDGDEFLVRPTAPAQWLIDFVDDIEEHGVTRAMVRFFDRVLLPESAELFADRLRSPDRPLDLHTLNQVFEWLTGEVYGLRPTGSSASSSTGQRTKSGRTSGAGASSRASASRRSST